MPTHAERADQGEHDVTDDSVNLAATDRPDDEPTTTPADTSTIRTANRPAAGLARPGVSPPVRWVAIGAATTGVALVVRLLRGR
jgi:hypothetical protein